METRIILPAKKGNTTPNIPISFEKIVVIGANGSGKTRFGSYIEENHLERVHRISAQKSLTFPTSVGTKSKEIAQKEFFYGNSQNHFNEQSQLVSKKHSRWSGNYNTSLLNDFEKLLVLLHTEEFEAALTYKDRGGEKPITKLDKVQMIWETLLPHRKLIKRAGVIDVFTLAKTQTSYNASEMSDGERVIFYLIGEVVCAPKNVILIIDEPEMHIHKSIVNSLFDLIENERKECAFVYLTHDIDFAFSRQSAIKIWAKSYEGHNVWDYEFLNDTYPIPEQLYLEILGSRRPVIFLEGTNSSKDYKLYQQVYKNYTLKPLGSCEKVVESVKSINEQTGFHNIKSYGIIDRDRRQQVDISHLNSKDIWVLDVAEAENLLLIEPIVKCVANYLGKDADAVFIEVKNNLLTFFNAQLDSQILLHFKEILRKRLLPLISFESKNISNAITEIDILYQNIDKQEIYDNVRKEFQSVVSNQDYNSILRLFNLKDALIPKSNICELIGIRNSDAYFNIVLTLLKKKDDLSKHISKSIDEKVIKSVLKPNTFEEGMQKFFNDVPSL